MVHSVKVKLKLIVYTDKWRIFQIRYVMDVLWSPHRNERAQIEKDNLATTSKVDVGISPTDIWNELRLTHSRCRTKNQIKRLRAPT